jgi:hypothetical protein
MPDPADRSVVPRWQRIGLSGAFAVFVAGAIALRFRTDSPLWLDEALTVDIARLPLGDIGPALRHDGHPPLFYWLLHGWLDLFGDGDVAARSLSGVLGVVALPLAWLAGRLGDGTRAGSATVLVVAVSPFAVRYATEARMYSLVVVLVLVGHLLVRRATDRGAASRPLLAGVALVTGLLLLTHYWAFFLVAAVAEVVVGWGRRRGQLPVAGRLVGAMAVGSLLFVPWLGPFLDQAAHTGTPWATAARPTVVANETLVAFGGGDHAEAGLLAALLVVLAGVGLFGRLTAEHHVEIRSRPAGEVAGEAMVVALTLGLGAVAGIVTDSTYAGRYAAVVFPLVAVVVGRGLAVLPGTAAPVAAAGSLLLFSLAGVGANIVEIRTQAGQIVDAVAAGAGPDDVVVTCPDQLGPAVRRALDHAGLAAMPVLAYPTLGDGRFVDWYDYVERNDAADPGAVAAEILTRTEPTGRVWAVTNGSYRSFEGDCEALLAAIATGRPAWHPVVSDRSDDVFEPAGLIVFEPTA